MNKIGGTALIYDVQYIIVCYVNELDIGSLSRLSQVNRYYHKLCNHIAKARLLKQGYNLLATSTNYIKLLEIRYSTVDDIDTIKFIGHNIDKYKDIKITIALHLGLSIKSQEVILYILNSDIFKGYINHGAVLKRMITMKYYDIIKLLFMRYRYDYFYLLDYLKDAIINCDYTLTTLIRSNCIAPHHILIYIHNNPIMHHIVHTIMDKLLIICYNLYDKILNDDYDMITWFESHLDLDNESIGIIYTGISCRALLSNNMKVLSYCISKGAYVNRLLLCSYYTVVSSHTFNYLLMHNTTSFKKLSGVYQDMIDYVVDKDDIKLIIDYDKLALLSHFYRISLSTDKEIVSYFEHIIIKVAKYKHNDILQVLMELEPHGDEVKNFCIDIGYSQNINYIRYKIFGYDVDHVYKVDKYKPRNKQNKQRQRRVGMVRSR